MVDPFKILHANIKKTRYMKKPRSVVKITVKDLIDQYNIQNGKCFWFGIRLTPHDICDTFNPSSMSVDRLDNNKGYIKGNFVICCRAANLGRNRTTFEDYKDFVELIKKGL